jgi:hypothetical protein
MFPLIFANMDIDSIGELTIGYILPIIAETRPAGLFCAQWGELVFEI